MTDIAEFIRARLDEDQAAAERGASGRHDHLDRDNYGFLWANPARVLAEVAAMRRMLGLRDSWALQLDKAPVEFRHVFEAQVIAADAIIQGYAAIWSSHPDYDPAWAPEGE